MESIAIEGFFEWDLRKDKVFLSKKYCEILGCEAFNMTKGCVAISDLCQNHQSFFSSIINQLNDSLDTSIFKYPIKSQYKNIRWLKCRCKIAEFDECGHPSRIIGSIIDITRRALIDRDRKQNDRTLKVLSNCNRELLYANNEHELLKGVCRIIVAGGYQMAWVGYAYNDEAKSVIPIAHAGFENGYLDTLKITWGDTERGYGPTGKAIRSGRPVITHNTLLDAHFEPWRKEATKRGYASILSLPLNFENKVIGALTIYSRFHDAFNAEEIRLLASLADNLSYGISAVRASDARLLAEKELSQSEKRYRTLFQNEFTVMMIINPENGRIIDVNPAAEKFYGWTKCEFLKMNISQINRLPEADIKAAMANAHSMKQEYFNFRHLLADGSTRDVVITSGPINIDGKSLLYSIIQDVTERNHYAHALHESNEKMRAILDTINAGLWEWDINTNECNWSDKIWQLFGVECNSFSPTIENGLNTVIEEDRALVQKALQQAFMTGSEYNCQWRIRDVDGKIRWLMGKGTPVKDAHGNIIKYVGIMLDITERRRVDDERSMLEARMRKSERLETLGTLAGGIAHDFNNILTPVLGYAEMGLSMLSSEDSLYEYFTEIMHGAERAQNLVGQILTFSKAHESESTVVNVQEIIKEALKLLRPSIPSSILIVQDIDCSCRNILADPSKIHQVIMNLCTNAYQAMEKSEGIITIRLLEVLPDNKLITRIPKLHKRPYIKLTISDNGCGIDASILEHIFEPFYTTKSKDKGTGLGLSVVNGIIMSIDGVIDVESTPQVGTAFNIYIPVVEAKTAIHKKTKYGDIIKARILLVDDDQITLKTLTKMLTTLGHQISAQNSPSQAIEHLKLNMDSYDVIITDLTMPGMTGLQLAQAINSYKPSLPIIVITGYGKDANIDTKWDRYGIRCLLKKPISLESLITNINNVLSGK